MAVARVERTRFDVADDRAHVAHLVALVCLD
jgi:hypothetical protein